MASIPKDIFTTTSLGYMFFVMTTEPIITNERVDDIPVLLTLARAYPSHKTFTANTVLRKQQALSNK